MTQLTDTPAVVETRLVHGVHRRATTLLADVLTRRSSSTEATRELRDFVVAMLRHHHEVEDRDLWPIIRASSPDLTASLQMLSDEHEHLDHRLDALQADPLDQRVGEARGRALALRDLVHEHLAHEEPILFPALEPHVSEAEWDGFSARTVASAPADGAHLLLALLDEVGPPAAVDTLLRHLPDEARATLPEGRAAGRTALADLR